MPIDPVEDRYPLSPMQQGMLVHGLRAPGAGLYVQQLVGALREALDVPAFRGACERVVARHPVFRTAISFDASGDPWQVVYRSAAVPILEEDWRGASDPDGASRLEAFLETDRRRGFDDIGAAPLMRLALIRLGAADYRFIWTSHHLLLDGRSRLTVLKELFDCYEALRRGDEPEWNPARRYREYVDWLGRQDIPQAESFWRRALAGFIAPTPLITGPAHRPGPAHGAAPASRSARLSRVFTAELRDLAQRHEVTLNTLVQGVWALLLGRYGGEADVLFGATLACRGPAVDGEEPAVGLFINTLPMRVRVPPEQRLGPWLRELRAQWTAMRQHEHTPLVDVRRWSDVPPGAPLFESLVVFERYSLGAALRSEGEGWERREFRLQGATNYPLTLAAYADPELLLDITYDGSRFEGATVGRMLGHLETLLRSFIADPDQRLSELPQLTAAERHQLVVEWNATACAYPRDRCLHQLVDAQAQRTPDAVAVVCGTERVTHAELDRRATQLAHHLRRHGVGPETRVAVCLGRSAELVVALLGILKAGGAYVPLDPSYPAERLGFMLADSGARLLITEARCRQRLPALATDAIVCIDRDRDAIERESGERLASGATPPTLAYVIYTSGSTGRAKGVAIAHQSAVALVTWAHAVYSPAQLAGVLASTSVCFDLSVFELFVPLASGGTVILAENALALPTLPAAGEVTLVNTVPSAMTELLRLGGLPAGVGTVNLAGEALPQALVEQLYQQGGDQPGPVREVYNLYGPTEDTTYSTFALISPDASGAPPIGGPIANSQAYVLDRHQALVPVGVVGELYLGGAGVARGYLGHPGLTAKRFLPDPFGPEPGARLYRTGDRVRRRSDGQLEFLGRLDHQVKLRGFRIEPGEIEAVLRAHPGVGEAAVLVREDRSGDPRLVAYVTPVGAPEGAAVLAAAGGELCTYLGARLPAHLVPQAVVRLAALPLTPNGKLDRRALPAPEWTGAGIVAPRTPVEETLAGLWAEVLGVTRVGVEDDFFALGGHSLLATRLMSRVQAALGAELPLRALFEAPTVARLAERVEAAQRGDERWLAQPPLARASREGALPLSFAQQRLWFLEQLEPGRAAYHIPTALHLAGRLDVAALRRGLTGLVRRHEALRTSFPSVDGNPVQRVAAPGPMALPVTDLSRLPEAERDAAARRLASAEAATPFDLARGPLLRARLLRLGAAEHQLVLVVHHIVSDGWSMEVFFRELGQLYAAFARGEPSPLPELAVQYADYAVWQRARLQGEVLEQELAYWRAQLRGAPEDLKLPTDPLRPAGRTLRSGRRSVVLPEPWGGALKALSRREDVTLFMLLLAGFGALLAGHTGQTDIVIGAPVAGRRRLELEDLIGCFVNTLVLRLDCTGDPTFRELLKRVRCVALEAYAHEEVPFDKVVQALRPDRDPSRNPLFQVLFVLRDAAASTVEIPGLSVRKLSVESGAARHDLKLDVSVESDGFDISFEFKTDLFEVSTIARMAEQLATLLRAVVAHPDAKLSALTGVLADAQRQRLMEQGRSLKETSSRRLRNIERKGIRCPPSNGEVGR